jgi:hypothetical protein
MTMIICKPFDHLTILRKWRTHNIALAKNGQMNVLRLLNPVKKYLSASAEVP